MGENSKIEWTHHTFNPWRGCVKVSPGCKLCYAESLARRYGQDIWGTDKPRIIASESYWKEPVKWNRDAEKAGERRRVFCASLADVFEDRPDLIEPRARLWSLIAATPALDWLLLTKRPENLLRMVPWMSSDGTPWANVWLGTTAENQEQADKRVPELLKVPTTTHFLSCEPLLGSVNLDCHLGAYPEDEDGAPYPGRIDWVICGGETSHGARLMKLEWARSLRDQCQSAGIPFHFKQWGEWIPEEQATCKNPVGANKCPTIDGVGYWCVGKKYSGRLLDGREWNEFPTRKETA